MAKKAKEIPADVAVDVISYITMMIIIIALSFTVGLLIQQKNSTEQEACNKATRSSPQ